MQKKNLFFILLILVISCQKDITPEEKQEKKCRLTRLVQGTHDGAADDTTFLFYYDTSGKITRITESLQGSNYNHNLEYDSKSRLIKISSDLYPACHFSYNTNGLLSEIRDERLGGRKTVFEYGASDLPVKALHYAFFNGQWLEPSEYRYTFQNGNLVMAELYDNGGAFKWKENYEYYEDLPNDVKDLSLISFKVPLGLFEEFLIFNKNMLKKATKPQSRYYIDYKLDSGRIAKSVFNWLDPSSNDTLQRISRFYHYECR